MGSSGWATTVSGVPGDWFTQIGGKNTVSNLFLNILKEWSWLNLLEFITGKSASEKTWIKKETRTVNDTPSGGGKQSFGEIIKKASETYGVDERIIRAVIKHESSFNPRAVSSCGAMGLMQLMPATARSLGVTDPFDAEENIMAGVRYLRQKLDEFDGNLPMALAAYNAGSGAVRKYGDIPPYKETRAYVKKIMNSIDHWA
ncbi:MAG: lytic transglycosylase domain-containing protein [Syntrophomonadaceae bacterium]|nr:lytic transglycosylase domain-containing protein [Syntrophomonadaceae bacterium]